MKKCWTGLVHVTPMPGSETLSENAIGAYVVVLALATGSDEYIKMVRRYLAWLELSVIEIEDIGLLEERVGVGEEVIIAIKYLTDEEPVIATTFHNYINDDDDE